MTAPRPTAEMPDEEFGPVPTEMEGLSLAQYADLCRSLIDSTRRALAAVEEEELVRWEPEPVGVAEIAMMAGVQKPVVHLWRKRHGGFPSPWAELSNGPVFRRHEVAAWLRDTGRRDDANLTLDQVRPRGFRAPRSAAPTEAAIEGGGSE